MQMQSINMQSIIANLSNLVEQSIISYVDLITSKYNLEKDELIRIWNEDIQTSVHIAKKRSDEIRENTRTCDYEYQKTTKTKNKGDVCGSIIRKDDAKYCCKHNKKPCEIITDDEDGSDKKRCVYKYVRKGGMQCNHVAMANIDYCSTHKGYKKLQDKKKEKHRSERKLEREERREKKKNSKKETDEEPEFGPSDVSSAESSDSDSDDEKKVVEEEPEKNEEAKEEPEKDKDEPKKEHKKDKKDEPKKELKKDKDEPKKDKDEAKKEPKKDKKDEPKKDKDEAKKKESEKDEHKKSKKENRKSKENKKTKPPIDRDELVVTDEVDLKDD